MTTYSVMPVPGGWSLIDDQGGMALMFLSGAKAQAKARQLARLSWGMGQGARVQVLTRDGQASPRLSI